MKVEVKINTNGADKLKGCKAFVSLTLDDAIVITGVKLMKGKSYWLAFPSFKGKDGEWHDLIYPLSKEGREALTKKVVKAYEDTPVESADSVPFE